MDQEAFRSLVFAPRAASSSQSKPGTSRGVLGAPALKRGWGIKPKAGHEYKPKEEPPQSPQSDAPAFVPRTHFKRPSDGRYKDRAEMRRTGVEDEYKPVEKLLVDFEKRKADAGDDADKIERTRAFLGGDATHSILVKGLDYALLAARKAELEREGEEVADEELEALLKDGGTSARDAKEENGKRDGKKVKAGEELNNRFKSIVQKKAEAEAATGEKKKKEKKKKVKAEPEAVSASAAAPPVKAELPRVPPPSKAEIASLPVPPMEDLGEDGDIFGDVGEYDLNAGAGDSDADSEGETRNLKDVETISANGRDGRRRSRSPPRRRERSRSRSYYDDERYRSRSRSRSYDRDHRRRRYRSRSPYHHRRPKYRSYSRSRSPPRRRDETYRPRSRSPRTRQRSYSRSPSPYRRRRSYTRSRSPPRRTRDSPSPRRDRVCSRSASPQSRSPSAPPRPVAIRRSRSRSRSPTPPLAAQPLPFSRSPSPSSASSDEAGPARKLGRLQPFQSSAITDLSSFLAADAESAKAEEKRLRKAKWRAAQGLATQDGANGESLKRKEVSEKGKANREYQLVMNKVIKEKQ